MKLTVQDNLADDTRTYTLRLTLYELATVPLTEFDKLLVKDCEGSNKVSDVLLALETIVRRVEERTPSQSSR